MALLGTTTIQYSSTHYGSIYGFKPGEDDGQNTSILYRSDQDKHRDFADYSFLDTDSSRRNSNNQSIGHYINIENEWMKITNVTSHKPPPYWFQPQYTRWFLQRDIFNQIQSANYVGYEEGTEVRFYDELPEDVQEFYAQQDIDERIIAERALVFKSEEESNNFGVDGYTVEQTLLNPFDPYSGMDINLNTFQNTNQGLTNSNQDGRIELGMFSFDDDNLAADNFPNILGPPFVGITKTNLVSNGDCKFVERNLTTYGAIPIAIQPEGDWRFLSLYEIDDENFINNYNEPDGQNFQGYGGRYNYVPLSLELYDTAGIQYWSTVDDSAGLQSVQNFFYRNDFSGQDFSQNIINTNIDDLSSLRLANTYAETTSDPFDRPHIAMWMITPEAYSNDRCLCFLNFQIWNRDKVFEYTSTVLGKYPFNYLLQNSLHTEGQINDPQNITPAGAIEDNQYRVLNQFQKIYDKFNDSPINPYSSLKIRFKMKTTHCLPPGNSIGDASDESLFLLNPLDESLGYAPEIEVGILQSQFEEAPKAGVNGIGDGQHFGEERFKSPGSFNSERYPNGGSFLEKKDSRFGGMSRFKNSIINEWETFEFNFNLRDEHNNRGRIYGVPYGGVFDDEFNGGPVEIMLNHYSDTNGIPTPNVGEIYFKVPNYQDEDLRMDGFYMRAPNGLQVYFEHGVPPIESYQSVVSALGDTAGNTNTYTGLQPDGKFLEAYLMYIGNMNLSMQDSLPYGGSLVEPQTDMVVAYWDGEKWSYDNNQGYSTSRYFTPNDECFILARLYRSPEAEDDGISGMDQYISNESQFPTTGVGNLFLFLQSGNNFQGRVLIDDIECYESYEFVPEVDVRKKKSVGNYGTADLTKYYDKDLEPEEYKDSQAPLEAQFYFYPQYPTDETFVERLPVYQDFKMGRFYIYDINWGDGKPNDFTAEPKQIDEDTALYHTYETNGVFEVTGTMLRVKTNEDDEIQGIAYNKKFTLRININPGKDEDFQYFGSDGFSFIPYQKTTPIIGGISNQSNYYKIIKRQLGFLENEKIEIEFKNQSDKLKTELALIKMENQNESDLEVLPNYTTSRTDENNNLIYKGITPIREELGKSLGDADLTSIKFYNNPKSIWELFGFNDRDSDINLVTRDGEFINRRTGELVPDGTLYHIHPDNGPMEGGEHNPNIQGGTAGHDFFDNTIANPNNRRYWKNIIPKNYSVFNRDGLGSQISISMAGRKDGVNGTPPHYNIIVNGVKLFEGFIDNPSNNAIGDFKDYRFSIPINFELDFQEIVVNFDNSKNPPIITGQRRLYVTSMTTNDVIIDGMINPNELVADEFSVVYESDELNEFLSNNPNQTTFDYDTGLTDTGFMPFDGNMIFKIPTSYFRSGIDVFTEQDWLDSNGDGLPDYYYPVLPKYGVDGRFIDDEDNLPKINNFAKIPFPKQGVITEENLSERGLVLNIINEKLDVDIFNDKSGNKNYAFSIEDFNPEFDDETLRVKKVKKRSIFKVSKTNGAF